MGTRPGTSSLSPWSASPPSGASEKSRSSSAPSSGLGSSSGSGSSTSGSATGGAAWAGAFFRRDEEVFFLLVLAGALAFALLFCAMSPFVAGLVSNRLSAARIWVKIGTEDKDKKSA